MKILETVFKGYWQFGFKTRLYDGLCPHAYHQSLQAAAGKVEAVNGTRMLDLGCGSGLLVRYLDEALDRGLRYVGTDRLPSGLVQLKQKAALLSPQTHTHALLSDMLETWPLKPETFDYVVAHFSVYTLNRAEDRRRVYECIARVLKPGGCAVLSNPSDTYNAQQIIKSSVRSQKGELSLCEQRVRRYLLYPMTLLLGLRHIQQQLENGVWHAYSREAFCEEVESAGLNVEQVESVYAGSGYLLVARKS
ncbi:class I SAM-dependent methyltransferase [Nitrospina watsonii]|uniref:Methyltransf_25 domain-containing protein n=1 Tax=Nitrospina watsonii TaxID=1323948 RepID=A0ABM9HEA3_9BACT|nr:class I SAM-dependent methyltransferase [Nitrospina watsonii]CAI2718480.1 Methyltransf_25 domain-containing protein [Nitrospina watsonii]